MFFKSKPRHFSTPKLADSQAFVSESDTSIDLDETTLSQRKVLCPSETRNEHTPNFDSVARNNLTSSGQSSDSNNTSLSISSKDSLNSTYEIAKKNIHLPLTSTVSRENNPETYYSQEEYELIIENHGDSSNPEADYYESELSLDSLDYNLYGNTATIYGNINNYDNTFNQTYFNFPVSTTYSNISPTEYIQPYNYTSNPHLNSLETMLHYYENLHSNPNDYDVKTEIIDEVKRGVREKKKPKSVADLEKEKNLKRSPSPARTLKFKFLGIQKTDPAQYVAKYGPNLFANLSRINSNISLNTQPSVKYFKLSN